MDERREERRSGGVTSKRLLCKRHSVQDSKLVVAGPSGRLNSVCTAQEPGQLRMRRGIRRVPLSNLDTVWKP